jgi:hypothetical protein
VIHLNTVTSRSVQKSLHCILSAFFVLACGSARAADGEARWRFSEQQETAMLAITDTDEASDSFGFPYFQCKKGSGTVEVVGTAKQDLRNAMANVIRANEYPVVNALPVDAGGTGLLELSYSELHEGWLYKFALSAGGETFDDFKRTGQLTFKIGKTVVREEFKAGLESAAKFQAICKQPSKRTSGQYLAK